MQCDDRQDALSVRLERRGYTHRPASIQYQRDVLDRDGRVVFRGSAHACTRWVNAGCTPEPPRERRNIETNPPGLFPVEVMDGAEVAPDGGE